MSEAGVGLNGSCEWNFVACSLASGIAVWENFDGLGGTVAFELDTWGKIFVHDVEFELMKAFFVASIVT
jgi:hypothetical protein